MDIIVDSYLDLLYALILYIIIYNLLKKMYKRVRQRNIEYIVREILLDPRLGEAHEGARLLLKEYRDKRKNKYGR